MTRVLVTGASSGLGRALAIELGRRGWRLALTGRRADALEETARLVREAGGEALPLAGSASDKADVERHWSAIREKWGGVDWAILNAGVSESMDAKSFSSLVVRQVFETNIFGVALWLEAVLPGMIERGSGLVAGVSSLASFRGLPFSGPYCASKAALNVLLESARVDLLGTGVDVVIVCPGFVKSEMTARNAAPMPFLMETKDGVAAILRGLDARRRIVHFPWPLSWPVKYVMARLPGWLYDRIAKPLSHMRKKNPAGSPPAW